MISSGRAPARKLARARILLKVDEGLRKTEVSQVLDVTINTVTNVCRTFQTQRLAAIERKKPDRGYEHSLDEVSHETIDAEAQTWAKQRNDLVVQVVDRIVNRTCFFIERAL